MKNIYTLLLIVFIWGPCSSSIHVNMFATPQVLIYTSTAIPDAGQVLTYYIQDTLDYYGFTIATNLSQHNLCFVEPYNNMYSSFTTQVDAAGNVSRLNCGDALTSDTLRWQALATLASDTGSANFDAQGPSYLGFKRKYPGGFQYGWFKVSCSASGDTLIVYGYGYDDQVSTTPNIVAGQGECVDGIPAISLPDVSAICYNSTMQVNTALPLQASLINMEGQVITQWNCDAGANSRNLTAMPHGVYLLEMQRGPEIKTMKVVL